MAQLLEEVRMPTGRGPHRVRLEPCRKRVRPFLQGLPVADSCRVQLLFETGHLPVYYFPLEDVRLCLTVNEARRTHCPYKGDATYYDIQVGERRAEELGWSYPTPLPGAPAGLAGLVGFYWSKVDAWFEEDDEVFVHARDPYHRIDVLRSSRHVEVVVDGTVVAATTRPTILFETGLPPRYYLPKQDVRLDLLQHSATTSRCPYKGDASYYSVVTSGRIVQDVAWCYEHPMPESLKLTFRTSRSRLRPPSLCAFDPGELGIFQRGQ